MKTKVRDNKPTLSEHRCRAALDEDVRMMLHSFPWVIPSNGNKPLGSANPIRIGPDEKNLAEIISGMRG